MCFNASLVQTAEIMAVEFNAYIDDSLIEPVYFESAFSLPEWPVLKDASPDRFAPLTWGLIPSWIKNYEAATDIRFKTLNARLETLHEKSSFRQASDNSRCAVPIDGWFEWKEVRGKKYPYFIHREDGKPFLLAGLWSRWVNEESNKSFETFSVVTTAALGICAQIHNTKERMPFILSKEGKDLWLDRNLSFSDLKENIIPQWKDLSAYPVSHKVSSSKENRNVPEIRDRIDGPAEQMEFF
ncbi:SOS response-associated peptidase [Spirochaeta isovalerica]|uniref:Abasic site processing protein n=1 Tax=Spirochaeta isovalerica TaxID=150 RepID=A0A841R0I0_9SPIO|nr:SOS response-associated peptidase [Spirochaeta isovalerica]MBB6478444.1 putative SOS response-associated peptidase YedK [Spirochaeta isovalerica]